MAAGVLKDRMPVVAVKEGFTPVTFNTERLAREAADLFVQRFGKDKVLEMGPVTGGEDFGEFHRADRSIESLIFWLGAANRKKGKVAKGGPTKLPSPHASKLAPDAEPTLMTGVEAIESAAMKLLAKP